MATDFWKSSHYKRWIIDRSTLAESRSPDVAYIPNGNGDLISFLNIYFANALSKLGKKLSLRQRVIATATVFFHRFYLKNAYCETDPWIVIAACVYLAAKAEESPVHIKNVISEARNLFSQQGYNIKNFPSDNTKLAEMEFYLVDDLECDLTVFHPYRTLLSLCKSESPNGEEDASTEAGEVGVGIDSDSGVRYWGTGEGKLELPDGALQTAWFIINDTYRSPLCLLYPPHLIAITAVYLTLILHPTTRATVTSLLPSSQPSSSSSSVIQTPRRTSRSSEPPKQDPISFLSSLSTSLPLISTISQEIISLYTLWDRYKEDSLPESSSSPPSAETQDVGEDDVGEVITPTYLSSLLLKMREARVADLAASGAAGISAGGGGVPSTSASPSVSTPAGSAGGGGSGTGGSGTGKAVNRLLERTQEGGKAVNRLLGRTQAVG